MRLRPKRSNAISNGRFHDQRDRSSRIIANCVCSQGQGGSCSRPVTSGACSFSSRQAMLQPLKLKPAPAKEFAYAPQVLRPLVDAAVHGKDLAPVILAVTRSLGFESFMFGVSLSLRPNAESSSFVFTTLPLEWVEIWDERAYVEIDPRVQVGLDTTLPLIWDQSTYRGRSRRLDAFLDAALEFGVASGVSVPIRDSRCRFAVC